MANGTTHKEIARADRMRERQAQERKATKNAIANLRDAARDLPAYREEQDSVSEVTVGIGERVKVGAKGIPPRALGLTLVILALAAAAVAILRALG